VKFVLDPFVGALPLRFGMTATEVRALMPSGPWSRGATRDDFRELGVNYDPHGLAAEFCLVPGKVELTFGDDVLLGPGAVPDLVAVLRVHDPAPLEYLGFLVFPKLGVNITGFHDGDRSQLAFNVFRRGFWDELLRVRG
jgi:hypothetical protein